MRAEDVAGFRSTLDDLDHAAHLLVDYAIECEGDPELAAVAFCREQSTAQWRRPGVDEDLRPRYGAKLIDLEVLATQPAFSYGLGAPAKGEVSACRIRIAHPHGNFGPRLPSMLTALLGEGAFFTAGIPVVRLLDITYPESYLEGFEGPQFGVDGLRQQLDAHDRPLFVAVIKPNIGLPPEPFAEIGYEAWVGGIDVAKDDEMLADVDWCPFAERTRLLGRARRQAEQDTGRPKVYLANVTDEVDRMRDLHDIGLANGANALLVSVTATGFAAARALRQHSELPLVGHFPLNAIFTRLPHFGVHTRVITALQRLAGCDAMVLPGFAPRMRTPVEDLLASVEGALGEMGPILPALPVLGGGSSASSVPGTHAALGTDDYGVVAGRGVTSHPDGPAAGARSIVQAWEAARDGVDLDDAARHHGELATALATFG